MSDHAHAAHGHDSHGGHDSHSHDSHGGTGKYWAVFAALCLFTTASFFTYSASWPFHDTPAVGWAFMMAVSCCKAMMVALFFMHLKWEAGWKYVLTIPACLMSVFLLCMLIPDVGLRMRRAAPERVVRMGDSQVVQSFGDASVDYKNSAAEGH